MLWAVHISDGILQAPWWLAGYALAIILLILSAWRVRDDEVPRIALLTAAFFVVSLIHVNVGPTSWHLLMNGLVGIILGPRAALAIFVGLFLQYWLMPLPHGGLQTLGINTCVLAIPALAVWIVFHASQRLPWDTYHDFVKHLAVPKVLAVREKSTPITVPDDELPWLREETERTRATINELGCDVVGDLADLTPRTAGTGYVDPSEVTDAEVLDAAVDAFVGMVEEYAALRRTRAYATTVLAAPIWRRAQARLFGARLLVARLLAAPRRLLRRLSRPSR